MPSTKAQAVEFRLDDLEPGPWTAFSPLNAGWSATSGWNGAYVRYRPYGNECEFSFDVTTNGTQVADGYVIATIPAADTDGNSLLPQTTVSVPVTTDRLQSTTPRSPEVRVHPNGTVWMYGISSSATVVRCSGRYSLDRFDG